MRSDDISRLVREESFNGDFLVHRDVFRDPDIFELEMRRIFESTWVFVGLERDVPNKHDYYSSWLGRQPIVIMRDEHGRLGAFYNSCRHRGALVCHNERGNAKRHMCPYHGWVYASDGSNIDVKDSRCASYPAAFDEHDHDLLRVPRFEAYRGFLFASASPNVPPLLEHLGHATAFLDLIVDQGPDGIELVPGSSTYRFKANWKLQLENCVDAYHFTSTHRSFMSIVNRRNSERASDALKAMDIELLGPKGGSRGNYTFKYGHAVTWGDSPNPEMRPIYSSIDEIRGRVGDTRTRWMFGNRNLTIFPNLQIADNFSIQMRVIRPISVDLTEMKIYCVAPVGESPQVREYRLRQYEDFFNVTGMATPDDTTCYEACQSGYGATSIDFQQGYVRGAAAVERGQDKTAAEIGVVPESRISGPFELGDETVFRSTYREWVRLMTRSE
jgi:phenylpropionate dioxygenase-like ring-hydroxylating dioxygenase large terminal subunit